MKSLIDKLKNEKILSREEFIALIEKYYRVIHKVTKHYGTIAAEIANGKEYNLDEIRTTLRARETQC